MLENCNRIIERFKILEFFPEKLRKIQIYLNVRNQKGIRMKIMEKLWKLKNGKIQDFRISLKKSQVKIQICFNIRNYKLGKSQDGDF